jgi:general secretion pathway protein B
MSFILDALKKSETDRQRQTEPALYEVRVARPARLGLPPWAVAIVALLGINLIVIVWLLAHRSSSPPTPAVAAGMPAAAPAPVPGQVPAVAAAPVPAPAPAYYYPPPAYPPPGAYPYAYPPPQQVMPAGQPVPQGAMYGPQPQGYGQTAPQQPVPQPQMAGTSVVDTQTGNPDDYAPAMEAPGGAATGRVRRGSVDGLPLYPDAEAATVAGMPRLRMDFHVYAAAPAQRFVMINMHRLHEGDVSPEGVRVDSITPDGADISRGGTKYFLPR